METHYELREFGREIRSNYLSDRNNPERTRRYEQIKNLILNICECENTLPKLKEITIANPLLWKWTEAPSLTGEIRYKFLNQRFYSVAALDRLEITRENLPSNTFNAEHVYPRSVAASDIVNHPASLDRVLRRMTVCILLSEQHIGLPQGGDGWERYLRRRDGPIDRVFDMQYNIERPIQELYVEWQNME